jgi:hypothetical protein
MWEAVALTLAGAAGNSIGKVLQKKGTLILPPLSFKLKVRAGRPSHPSSVPGSPTLMFYRSAPCCAACR